VPVRVAAAAGSLAVVAFYLIAQMVGAGNLIRLLFGLSYETAVIIVGAVMLAYVLFGGMIATTWVQIVKAVLLLLGAFLLALLVLIKFSFNPLALFDLAARQYGAGVLAPGRLVSDPVDAISLGLALMFGTAGLPHILMRFYTVPDARTARVSVAYATAAIGAFYLLTFILGFGAMVLVGQDAIRAVDAGGNMAAPLLAEAVGGQAFLGFIAAVAFATILAVVAGLTLAGAAALSRPCRPRREGQRKRRAQGRARRDDLPGRGVDRVGHRVQGTERRLHGRARIRDCRQRQLPRPHPLDVLAAVHHARRADVDPVRHRGDAGADLAVADHSDGSAREQNRLFPVSQSGAVYDSVVVHRRHRDVVAGARDGRERGICQAGTPDPPRRRRARVMGSPRRGLCVVGCVIVIGTATPE
jgi:hypothetical protein